MEIRGRHILAGVLVWLAVFGLVALVAGPTAFLDAATGISGPRLAAMLGLNALGTILMGLVLYTVSRGAGIDVSAAESILLNIMVNLANNFMPLGQASSIPVGGAVISQWTGETFERSLAALSMKEVVGFVPAVLVFLFGGSYIVLYGPVVSGRVRVLVTAFTIGVAGFVVAAGLVYRNPDTAHRVLHRAVATLNRGLSRLPRVSGLAESEIQGRVDSFVESVQQVTTDTRTVVLAASLRTTAVLTQGALLWLALGGVGVDIPLALAVFIVPVSLLASAVPLPGGTGGIEAAQILLVAGATGGSEAAVAAAVAVSRGLVFWTPIVLGLCALTGIQVRDWWLSTHS